MRPPCWLAGACLVLTACGRGDHHAWDWERMRQQPRYDVYEPSRFFADSAAMQRPPAGTIPREAIVGQPLLTTGQDAGRDATTLPVAITPALLSLGRSRFHIFCAVCHGAGGYGGSIVATNMQPPRPPSLRSSAMRALPAGFVFHVITSGFGRMPAYSSELSVRERWAVVAYLRRLQRAGSATTPEERADSTRAALLQAGGADTTGRAHTGLQPPSAAVPRP